MTEVLKARLQSFWLRKKYDVPVDATMKALTGICIVDMKDLLRTSFRELGVLLPESYCLPLRCFILALPLDADVLEAIGVKPEIIAAWKAREYKTARDIINSFSNKGEIAKRLKLTEPTVSNIWAFVARYKENFVPHWGVETKRLRQIVDDIGDRHTFPGFMNRLLLVTKGIDFSNPVEIGLSLPLWGIPTNQKFLLRRAGTAGVASKVVTEFLRGGADVILAGSQGIGKSCEGIFIIKELIDREYITLFEHNGKRMLILGERALAKHGEVLTKLFVYWKESPLTEPGVYEFLEGSNDLFKGLRSEDPFVTVLDIDSDNGEVVGTNPCKIIISSPNRKALKRIGEVRHPVVIYLGEWTREDMTTLNERLPEANQSQGSNLVRKSDEDLEELIDIFGCLPKEVFKDRSVDQALRNVKEEVSEVSLETWRSVLIKKWYTSIPKLGTGMYVHVAKHAEPDESCYVRFASNYVVKLVVRRFYKTQRVGLWDLVCLATDKPRLFYQLQPEMLQQQMLDVLFGKPRRLSIRLLSAKADKGPVRTFIIPRLKLKGFESNKMADLKELAENDLCVAASSNFPSVETFMIVKRRLLGFRGDGLCIVCLQATTRSQHMVKREGLKVIQTRCCELVNLTKAQLPIYLLFVTTKNGIQARQQLGMTHEPFDDKILQFTSMDIEFDEALKVSPTIIDPNSEIA